MSDVPLADWLANNNLSEYTDAFESEGYDCEVLSKMSEEELSEVMDDVNMKKGHRRKLPLALERVREEDAAARETRALEAKEKADLRAAEANLRAMEAKEKADLRAVAAKEKADLRALEAKAKVATARREMEAKEKKADPQKEESASREDLPPTKGTDEDSAAKYDLTLPQGLKYHAFFSHKVFSASD